jgi:hypothetical protein
MEGDKFFEKPFARYPGLDLVVSVVTLLMIPVALPRDTVERWSVPLMAAVWFGAFLLFRLSSYVDNVVFDAVYGTVKKRLRKYAPAFKLASGLFFLPVLVVIHWLKMKTELDGARENASTVLTGLQLGNHKIVKRDGNPWLYSTATTIFRSGEEWENKVKARLEYSKAARVFITPLLLVMIWEILQITGLPPLIHLEADGLIKEVILAFNHWWVVYLALQLFAFVYLSLRISHMVKLYGMFEQRQCFRFEVVNAMTKVGRTMLVVRSTIVPLSALPFFQRRVLCVGIDQDTAGALEDSEWLSVKLARNCEQMRRALKDDDFDFVIVSNGFRDQLKSTNMVDADRAREYPLPGFADVDDLLAWLGKE